MFKPQNFQNSVLFFLFEEIEKTVATLPKAFDLSYLHVKFQKVLTKNDVTVVKRHIFLKISENHFIMAPKWRYVSKFLCSIEKGDQCNSFDMPIKSLRQLITALSQMLSFFLYIGHMTSPEHFLVKKQKKVREPRDYVLIYCIKPKS